MPTAPALRSRPLPVLLASILLLASCGGGDGGSAAPPAPPPAPTALDSGAVEDWNRVAEEAVSAPGTGLYSTDESRLLAIVSVAVHNTLNGLQPRYQPYQSPENDLPALRAESGADPNAALAAAARDTLVALLPSQRGRIEARATDVLARIPAGPARDAGLAFGAQVARALLDKRAGDGAAAARAGDAAWRPAGTAPGQYQLTAGAASALDTGWGAVASFVLRTLKVDVQALAAAPHPPASTEFAADLAEVRALGARSGSSRSADQSAIAAFWVENSPVAWNRLARERARAAGLDNAQQARLYAALHLAVADALIEVFATKYRAPYWRPETAIRATADPAWEPLSQTPPTPDYSSAHAGAGAAAAAVLAETFGDALAFGATSRSLPGVTRSYGSFSAAARENAESRIFIGFHFRKAVDDGLAQGRRVGEHVARTKLCDLATFNAATSQCR